MLFAFPIDPSQGKATAKKKMLSTFPFNVLLPVCHRKDRQSSMRLHLISICPQDVECLFLDKSGMTFASKWCHRSPSVVFPLLPVPPAQEKERREGMVCRRNVRGVPSFFPAKTRDRGARRTIYLSLPFAILPPHEQASGSG
jgi:hypothetical protein